MSLDKIIVALDFTSLSEVKKFLAKFEGSKVKPLWVKVGMELFYAEGLEIIDYLKKQNLKIFLDLKIHDIPNTASGALRSLGRLGVDLLNVHASGGITMMREAKFGLEKGFQEYLDKAGMDNSRPNNMVLPKLIAVTQLTSTDQNTMNQELNISGSIEEAVLRLAKNTQTAGLDGIVCSARELKIIKANLAKDFICVCPGIRIEGAESHDQKRTESPQIALANGADYLVIGRSITQAEKPAEVLASCTI